MSRTRIPGSRRRLLLAAVSLPLVAAVSRRASAQDKVDPAQATAKALSYTHASKVAGSTCAGCQFFQGGDAAWGPCVIFAGALVSAGGHCTAYAKRA